MAVDEVSAATAGHAPASVAARLDEAWRVRQRDRDRALALVDEISSDAASGSTLDRATRWRATIVRAAVAIANDDPAAAITSMMALLDELRSGDDPIWLGRALGVIGDGFVAQKKNAEALPHYVESLEVRERAGDRRERIDGYRLMSDWCNGNGDYRQSASYAERALELSEQIGDERLIGDVLIALAIALRPLGRTEEALGHVQRSLEISRRMGNRAGEQKALNTMGNILRQRGELDAAKETLERALAMAIELGDWRPQAMALHNLAIIHGNQGDLRRALERFQASLQIADRESYFGVGNTLIGIGDVCKKLGDLDAALEWTTRALQEFERRGDRSGLGYALANLGMIHQGRKELDRAAEYLERCRALREELGQKAGVAAATQSLGKVEDMRGNYELAAEHYERAKAIYAELGDRVGLRSVRYNIGVQNQLMGKHTDAVEILSGILEEFREQGERTSEYGVLDYLSRSYEALGDHAAALESLKRSYAIRKEIESEEAHRRLRQIESDREIELARKEAEIERLRNVELAQAHASLQQAHEELKSAQAQLVHAGKMASLGQLTAGIAHEINNPTNFVRNSVAPLRRDIEQLVDPSLSEADRDEIVAEIYALLRGIEDGASRTAEIVRGLRTFSRLDEDERKEVDIAEGIESTLSLLGSQLGERITVHRRFADIPAVPCYPGQINQVFMNLIANAIDAIDGRGEITVATSVDGSDVIVEVSDTGSGIAPEHRERIFEPFFTTKDVGAGQGLGLSISHGIVAKHGGRIEVESARGSGSTFRVVMPLAGH
jgi:signal transduction histidine kinase